MGYNSIFDLRGKRIEDTYNQVLQYDTSSGDSYTGQGLQLYLTSSLASQSLSSSYSISASYAPFTDNPNAVSASWASQSLSASVLYNPSASIDTSGNEVLNSSLTIGGLAIIDAPLNNVGRMRLFNVFNSSSWDFVFDGTFFQPALYALNTNNNLPTTASITANPLLLNPFSPGYGGNVGIGLPNPQNLLDVGGNISCSVITASLNGTASYALSASYAPFTDNPNAVSASWASSSISCKLCGNIKFFSKCSSHCKCVMGKPILEFQLCTIHTTSQLHRGQVSHYPVHML